MVHNIGNVIHTANSGVVGSQDVVELLSQLHLYQLNGFRRCTLHLCNIFNDLNPFFFRQFGYHLCCQIGIRVRKHQCNHLRPFILKHGIQVLAVRLLNKFKGTVFQEFGYFAQQLIGSCFAVSFFQYCSGIFHAAVRYNLLRQTAFIKIV